MCAVLLDDISCMWTDGCRAINDLKPKEKLYNLNLKMNLDEDAEANARTCILSWPFSSDDRVPFAP